MWKDLYKQVFFILLKNYNKEEIKMAFKFDDIVIDRIQMAIAEKSDGTLLYTLTQLSEATIETTAESKEARDANGSLIKTFYPGKLLVV